MHELYWSQEASDNYETLRKSPSLQAQYKAVRKTLSWLASNPRHPDLQTHIFSSFQGPNGEKVFEAYTQQKRPAANRVFWYYGPDQGSITILAITPHP